MPDAVLTPAPARTLMREWVSMNRASDALSACMPTLQHCAFRPVKRLAPAPLRDKIPARARAGAVLKVPFRRRADNQRYAVGPDSGLAMGYWKKIYFGAALAGAVFLAVSLL